MPPKKQCASHEKNQLSVLQQGVTSTVFPLPVDERKFPDAKDFQNKCNEVLVGQIVHVTGDYWDGTRPQDLSRLYPCKVVW